MIVLYVDVEITVQISIKIISVIAFVRSMRMHNGHRALTSPLTGKHSQSKIHQVLYICIHFFPYEVR